MAQTARARRLLKVYGLTEADFARLEQLQEGTCSICHKVPRGRLQVDHDHKTGEIRGLLCWRCNRYLHYWMTRDWLMQAHVYMDPWNWTGKIVPSKQKQRHRTLKTKPNGTTLGAA